MTEFAWIFALIAGAVILFLAATFANSIFKVGSYKTQADIARNLDNTLNDFASTKNTEITLSKPISLPYQSDINFECRNGVEEINVIMEKSDIPFTYPIKNKYIFSENITEKNVWIFSKPFEMPWKVDDMIYILTKKYCFVSPPEEIWDEINSLNSSFLEIQTNENKCTSDVKVCFDEECDIEVDSTERVVKIGKKELPYFDTSTMYAAIFGSEIYSKCIERVFDRLEVQANILYDYAFKISQKDCLEMNPMKEELIGLKSAILTRAYADIAVYAGNIENNNPSNCPLY